METQTSQSTKIYIAVIAVLGWFALAGQFYITASQRINVFSEMLTRYFTYFTIQTNILVAVCCTTLLFRPQSRWGQFFSRQQTLTCVTVYIVIVGLIYNTILRFTWSPAGFQKLIDEILHSVIPALVLIYWLVIVPKNKLQWKDVLPWLIYPFIYIIFVLIRGSASGFYPYPFINTARLGLNKVLVNSVGITLLFIFVSIAFVTVGKALNKKI